MPRGFVGENTSDGGNSDFLKLEDGDSALIVLAEEPFIIPVHKIEDGSQYGKQFHCGQQEINACPVCENVGDQYKPEDRRRSSKGFYPVFVQSITRKGKSEPETVEKMMVMAGGWTVIKAFKAAHESQQEDGETLVNVPARLSREGESRSTTYSLQVKPNAKVTPSGTAIDVEELALKFIRKDQTDAGYDAIAQNSEEEDPFEEDEPARKAA